MAKFDEIKATFEQSISGSSWWARHIGSQFVDYLVLFVTKVIERTENAAKRALQESFLSLATKRTSILAAAETGGYVGRKAMPSKGTARITNKSQARITLPMLSQVVADNQIRYTIMESCDLLPNKPLDITIQQFEVMTIQHTVTDEKPWLSIVFPAILTSRIHNIIVRVNGETWRNAFKFRDTDGDSKAYMEYYKSTDQYGVKFGNGTNGAIPSLGASIEFELWLTDGVTTLLNDQNLTLIGDTLSSSTIEAVEIKTTASVIGGAEPEDIESIRNGALYLPIYDEQIAWNSDYVTFIKRSISGVTWLSVWGEREQEALTGRKDIANINTIFISVHSADKPLEMIHNEIIELFDSREGYNEQYKLVARKRQPFTLAISGTIDSSKDPDGAALILTERLTALFGENASYNGIFHKHQIWREIESMRIELGINYFDVTTTGILEIIPIDTHHFLDMTESVIELGYA